MKILYFYTAPGCQLCEKAKTLIWPVLDQYGYRLQDVEIGSDNNLQARYATRIPVIRRDGAESDLGWPFTSAQLAKYLATD